ncbi:MAG: hypothetical protein ACRDZO_17940 [Egibacteraceae bacterium]
MSATHPTVGRTQPSKAGRGRYEREQVPSLVERISELPDGHQPLGGQHRQVQQRDVPSGDRDERRAQQPRPGGNPDDGEDRPDGGGQPHGLDHEVGAGRQAPPAIYPGGIVPERVEQRAADQDGDERGQAGHGRDGGKPGPDAGEAPAPPDLPSWR